MRKIILILILSVLITGCTEQTEKQATKGYDIVNDENPQMAKPVSGPSLANIDCNGICEDSERLNPDDPCQKQDCISNGECGDDICDAFEKRENVCPQDCNEEEIIDNQLEEEKQLMREDAVTETGSVYAKVTTKPAGWFRTGQDAHIILSGIDFDNTGGSLMFNHPGGIATDGKRLILADRFNNRILIWNSLPDSNTLPDVVLGQDDFVSNSPGSSMNRLNWPVAVATDGTRLIVADTYNDRILIWNSFPTENMEPADIEIKDEIKVKGMVPNRNPKRQVGWPWAVWTDGKRLVVTSTSGATVLIWNKFPTINNQEADISIRLPAFGTPRTIGSDGKHLVVGDHNANGHTQGNYFWRNFPTKDDEPYDFMINSIGDPFGEILWGPTFVDDKLIALGSKLYIWNSFPEDEKDMPDVIIGASRGNERGYRFIGGDGSGVAAAGDKLYISLYNGNKIVGYNKIPSSDKKPDFSIGADEIDSDTLEEMTFITNPIIVTDGRNLLISSDFDRKLHVFNALPDESGAKADIIYDLELAPWDSVLYNNTFILGGKDKVHIWENLPLNKEMADIRLEGKIGSIIFNDITGVALDDKYFYLSDSDKIYVWESIPDKDARPKFVIDCMGATRLSSDGNYLAVAATDAEHDKRIKFYTVGDFSAPIILKGARVNLPQDVLIEKGHFFIGDTGFNRVLVWNDIQDAVSGKSPDIILGEENIDDVVPEIGKDKLFWPAGLAFDGSFLWVGEFKFSGRILRFDVG